jgi:hypothetical protein
MSGRFADVAEASPGYGLLQKTGAAIELAGIGLAVSGRPEGAALAVAGKLTSMISETVALAKEKIDLANETIFVKAPAYLAGAAAKVLLPSVATAPTYNERGYRILSAIGQTLEVVGILGVATDLAFGGGLGVATRSAEMYMVGKTIALAAESVARVSPQLRGGA